MVSCDTAKADAVRMQIAANAVVTTSSILCNFRYVRVLTIVTKRLAFGSSNQTTLTANACQHWFFLAFSYIEKRARNYKVGELLPIQHSQV